MQVPLGISQRNDDVPHLFLETWVILGGPLVVILGLLALPLISNRGDRAPSRRPWSIAILVTSITALIILTIYGA